MDELVCFVGGMFALAARSDATDDANAATTRDALLELGDGIAETCFRVRYRLLYYSR